MERAIIYCAKTGLEATDHLCRSCLKSIVRIMAMKL